MDFMAAQNAMLQDRICLADDVLTLTHDESIGDRGPIRGLKNRFGPTSELSIPNHDRIVMFWGVHASRKGVERRDRRTLDGLLKVFRPRGAQTRILIVLTDVHADFNGFANPEYLRGMGELIVDRDCELRMLSQIYEQRGMSHEVDPVESLEDYDESLIVSLLRSAGNRNGGEHMARRYVALRLQEDPAIAELAGENGAFAKFGEPSYAQLFRNVAQMVFLRGIARQGARWQQRPPWI